VPHYTFELRRGSEPVHDDIGVHLPDRVQALAYAEGVARELMQGREVQTRSWRLDVYENHNLRLFELLFATLDPTLDHLDVEFRNRIETVCDLRRSTSDAIHAARVTVRETRALMARSRGQPYLAAVAGKQTIR